MIELIRIIGEFSLIALVSMGALEFTLRTRKGKMILSKVFTEEIIEEITERKE